jgi:predicted N-formylglutamate amidohydrolase
MTLSFAETDKAYDPPLLGPDEPSPFTVLNPDGKAHCLLICDHASNRVPAKLEKLGLSDADLEKHIAWDIGVAKITEVMSERLDAPAIMANYSRLVVDLNRRIDHPTAFVTSNEGQPIPGNITMTQDDKNHRVNEIYGPYHEEVTRLIDGFLDKDIVPALISIHSFTPVFYKQVRPWEIGVLWVQDERLPLPTIEYFRKEGFTVGDNEPYDARILRGTTINYHADARRLPNALVEIRNDLISNDKDSTLWGERLSACYKEVLGDENLFTYYDGPVMDHDPEREFHYFEELIQKAKRGEL